MAYPETHSHEVAVEFQQRSGLRVLTGYLNEERGEGKIVKL